MLNAHSYWRLVTCIGNIYSWKVGKTSSHYHLIFIFQTLWLTKYFTISFTLNRISIFFIIFIWKFLVCYRRLIMRYVLTQIECVATVWPYLTKIWWSIILILRAARKTLRVLTHYHWAHSQLAILDSTWCTSILPYFAIFRNIFV